MDKPIHRIMFGRSDMVFAAVFIAAVALGFILSVDNTATAQEEEPVVVEATGIYYPAPDCPVEEAHQAALMNAREYALAQAHVLMDVQAKTSNMRLVEKTIRSYTAGYVSELKIIEAGPVPDSKPPIYRVRVRAKILPAETFAAGQPFGACDADMFRPRVLIKPADGENLSEYVDVLQGVLFRCGVSTVSQEELDGKTPVISVEISMVSRRSEDAPAYAQASWILTGEGGAPETTMRHSARILGSSEIYGEFAPGSEWWQRVSTMIAQDAIRMWNTPRMTWISVENGGESLTKALMAIGGFRPVQQDAGPLEGIMTIAGDPAISLLSALNAAGVGQGLRVESASLFHVRLNAAVEDVPAD